MISYKNIKHPLFDFLKEHIVSNTEANEFKLWRLIGKFEYDEKIEVSSILLGETIGAILNNEMSYSQKYTLISVFLKTQFLKLKG